jgi:hypothetical protein
MPRRFLLERVYASAEHDSRCPATLRAVGTLLDAAIEGAPPDPELDALLKQLDQVKTTTLH